jgi:hypothetical protein
MEIKKTLKQMVYDPERSLTRREGEAKEKHMVKLLFQKDGKTYASFRKPGSTIQSQDGRRYYVAEDGSLRRIK